MILVLNHEETWFPDEVRSFLRQSLSEELRLGQYLTASVYPEPEISGRWQQALQRRGWLCSGPIKTDSPIGC